MLDLSLAQHERGHSVTVITRFAEDDAKFDSQLPFDVIRVPANKSFLFGWKAFREIGNLLFRPDVIHSHGPAAFYYLIRRNNSDPPIVHTVHAVRRYQFKLFQDLPNLVKDFERTLGSRVIQEPKYYKKMSLSVGKEFLIEKYICQHADHVAVVAKYFANQVNKYYGVPLDKISVTYNGSTFSPSEVTNADTSALRSFGIYDDNDIILYVGRTDWVKRVHILVQAMPTLLKRFPRACLVIVGTGDQKADLLSLIEKLRLRASVKLLGWIPHKNLPSLFKVSKCFCLPSYWEGLSKSLLEAMSAKVPIVATNNPSNRAVLQNSKLGWLVMESTPVAWSKTIEKILAGGGEVQEKTHKGAKLLDQMYRWDHVTQRIDTAYQKVLEQCPIG